MISHLIRNHTLLMRPICFLNKSSAFLESYINVEKSSRKIFDLFNKLSTNDVETDLIIDVQIHWTSLKKSLDSSENL